jgi:hypothetical protein
MMRARWLGFAIVLVLFAACGSSAPPPPSPTAFCEQFRAQGASAAARCSGGDAADWLAQVEQYTPCARFGELVTGGTVRYHADLAAACLKEASADVDCNAPASTCFTKTLEGLLPADAPCHSDWECPDNGVCWAPGQYGANACVQNVCVTIPNKAGDLCPDTQPFCFGELMCVGGTCVANATAGQACGPSVAACAHGLRCDLASRKCVARSDGSVCVADNECPDTQYCAGSTCSPRIPAGGSCNGMPNACAAWMACNLQTFVCEAAGHVGQQCGLSGGSAFLCAGGVCTTYADGTSSCHAPAANGQPCGTGDDCVSGGCNASLLCAMCTN